jgi:hypothetical protein
MLESDSKSIGLFAHKFTAFLERIWNEKLLIILKLW